MDGAGREGPGVVVAADNEELGANFGLFQCPQEGLDPDNGTELETLETELDREDEEEGDPTMGPHFRAAEQSWNTEFQIFPVSLGGLGAGTLSWSHTWPHSFFFAFFALA